jgi:hypothetical protein
MGKWELAAPAARKIGNWRVECSRNGAYGKMEKKSLINHLTIRPFSNSTIEHYKIEYEIPMSGK